MTTHIEVLALLEREGELAAIRSILESAESGDGRIAIIEGEPGIGKSALLDEARQLAAERSLQVLDGRAGELERQYANGVVLDLFGQVVRSDTHRDRLLTGLAGTARPVFEPGRAEGADPDALGVVHGLYWLTVQLAESGPMLIAVDDVPWADDASARFLAYLARRIRDLPVALVMTMRPPSADESPAVGELRTHRDAVIIRPARLSADAVEAMLASLGVRPERSVVEAWWSATRGTPLYLREVAQQPALALEGPSGVETLDTLSRSIRRRVGVLPSPTADIAEAIGLLGNEATLDRACALAAVDETNGIAAVRRLTDEGILERQGPLRFAHPIVRSAVVDAIPLEARDAMRRRAAELLARADLVIEAAAHLTEVRARPDPSAVEVLRRGAAAARAQGDAAVAVTFLEAALRHEPGARARILRELAEVEASIGRPSAADHFRAAIEETPTELGRGALHLGLGHALIKAARWDEAMQAFETGQRLVGTADPKLSAALEAGYVASAWVSQTNLETSEAIVARLSTAEALTIEQVELVVSRTFVQGTAAIGTATDLTDLTERVIAGIDIDTMVQVGQLVELTTGVFSMTDEQQASVALLTSAIDAVPRTGMIAKLGLYSYCRAWPRYVVGDLNGAAADAAAAMHAHELGWETFFPVAGSLVGFIELDRGDYAAAAAAIDAVERQGWTHRVDHTVFLPQARGRLLLATGDARRAADEFLASGEAAAAVGMRSPAPADWRSWAATALARSGRRDRALQLAEDGLEIARAWGAHWPLAMALRGAGIARGGAAGIDTLREAVDIARSSPSRTEEVRNLLELGAALRRAGSLVEARQVLAEAVDLGHRIGAYGLAERARDETVAAGGRPRRTALTGRASLTPAELRVVELVAEGRSNRQVAEALFVTPKAIEYHLGNAYRKLGITSRSGLSEAITEPEAAG